MEWNVPPQMRRVSMVTSCSTRLSISRAALLVKVTRRMSRRIDAVLDEPRDAVGERARLAAPRAGDDQHRPLAGHDHLELLGVQLVLVADAVHLLRLRRRLEGVPADFLGHQTPTRSQYEMRCAAVTVSTAMPIAPRKTKTKMRVGRRSAGGSERAPDHARLSPPVADALHRLGALHGAVSDEAEEEGVDEEAEVAQESLPERRRLQVFTQNFEAEEAFAEAGAADRFAEGVVERHCQDRAEIGQCRLLRHDVEDGLVAVFRGDGHDPGDRREGEAGEGAGEERRSVIDQAADRPDPKSAGSMVG